MRRIYEDFRRFFRSEEGSQSVEMVIVFPLLVFAVILTWDAVEAFRVRALTTQATYTVADMISRRSSAIDQGDIERMGRLVDFLVERQDLEALRVSVLHCVSDCGTPSRSLSLDWSAASGAAAPLGSLSDAPGDWGARVPDAGLGERLVVVEARVGFSPAFATFLSEMSFGEVMVVRPRFTPRLCWQDCAAG